MHSQRETKPLPEDERRVCHDAERSKQQRYPPMGRDHFGEAVCEAGRIKYHLREKSRRATQSSILIAGFQAAGTLAVGWLMAPAGFASLASRCRTRPYLPVGGLSAHADQSALLGWLGAVSCRARGGPFVVHGEHRPLAIS